ncbi:MAG: alpha/beta hydrolase [Deltaproteobacteria bacterium]|nr:alpha/beta hydrolase [Deltaproteobacteria bacterium]
MAIHFEKFKKNSTNDRINNFRQLVTRILLKIFWSISPAMTKRFVKNHIFKPADYQIGAEERKILENGQKFQFDIHGKTIRGWKWGKGRGILFVHGWNGRGIQFYKFFKSLRKAGFAIITFDAPGHGESTGKTSSYFEWTDTVRAILTSPNEFNISGIIAHSLGGSAVINMLSKEKVSVPNVLLAPAIKLKQILFNTFNLFGIPPVIYKKVIEEYEHRFGYTLKNDNPSNLISQVNTDLLIVHDQEDGTIPFLDSKQFSKTLPAVRLHETNGLGHKQILTDRKIVELVTEYIISQNMSTRMRHSDLHHTFATDCQPVEITAINQR